MSKVRAGLRPLGAATCVLLLAGGCGSDREDEAVRDLFDDDYAFGVDDFLRAAGEGDAQAVGRFLAAGMEADVTDLRGERALIRAASSTRKGAAQVVRVLLDHGAAPEAVGEATRSPLILAAGAPNAEAVAALLDAGADPLRRDPVGWSALTYAAARGDARCLEALAPVSRPLLDDALLVASLHGRADHLDILLAHGANIQARSDDGNTALTLSASRGHHEAVVLLLHRGANRFALNNGRRTAAERALEGGFSKLAALLSQPPTPTEISGDAADPLALRDEAGQLLDRPAVDGAECPPRLMGATLTVPAASAEELGRRAHIRDYRERQLPVILEDVDPHHTHAELRLLYGNHATVEVPVGSEVPEAGLRLLAARRQFKPAKDASRESINASRAILEDTYSGQTYDIAADETARSARTGAVLDFSGVGADLFEAHRDDEFTVPVGQGDTDDHVFRILDVRPDQVVVECVDTGEVVTIPRER